MTLYAKWTEEQAQQGESGWINPFKDVSETDWFYSTVRFVNENGLFGGISETEFVPYMSITRGMVVTVLHRLENSPEAAAGNTFADVEPDAYYANSVAWAEESMRWAVGSGIITGRGSTVDPSGNATRAETAAMIQRLTEIS